MRAHLPSYEMKAPCGLDEVLALLANEPGVWRPFAGGTDLMVLFESGKLAHRKFVNIWGLSELRGIRETKEHVTLGALATYSDVQSNAILRREYPMLCQAAAETGAVAIQNRGTIGGNIANASPAADSPPALLAYDAEVELVSAKGSRWVRYSDFHLGYKKTALRPDELLARVRLPRVAGERVHFYRKVGTRKAQAISKICFAGVAWLGGGRFEKARISLGSVAPTVVGFEASTFEEARSKLPRLIAPIDDVRSTAAFRLRVAQNVLEEFLKRCGTGSAS